MSPDQGVSQICSFWAFVRLSAVTAIMADDEWLSATIEEINGFLKGGLLEGAPGCPCLVHRKGIQELFITNRPIAKLQREKERGEVLRLVDRSFTIKGLERLLPGH